MPYAPPIPVSKLLDVVEHLDGPALDAFLDGLAGSQRIEDAGWRVRERRLPSERFAERNRKIRLLAKRLSYGQIANRLGMSRANVAKICQRGRKKKSVDTETMSTAPHLYTACGG